MTNDCFLAGGGKRKTKQGFLSYNLARLGPNAAPIDCSAMQPVPCDEAQLQGCDLKLVVIVPTRSPRDGELRYRCPVERCPYLGATLNHARDCLLHMIDCKSEVAAHDAFWDKTLVCFRNGDGKPALHSKPTVQPAWVFRDAADPQKRTQHAYSKVRHGPAAVTGVPRRGFLSTVTFVVCGRRSCKGAVCVPRKLSCQWCSHARAVPEGSARSMLSLKPCR